MASAARVEAGRPLAAQRPDGRTLRSICCSSASAVRPGSRRGYLGLGLTHDKVTAAVLLAAYGIFTAATDGVGKAWVSSLVGPDEQGTAQGWFQGLSGVGMLMAGVWAGLAWDKDGTAALLVSGSVGAAIAVWLLASRSRTTTAAATPAGTGP